jgi:hypothetical protein
MAEMIKGKRLTVFIGEDKNLEEKPLYLAVLEILKQCDITGATVTRGITGLNYGGQLQTPGSEYVMADFPIIVEAIDEEEKINAAVKSLSNLPEIALLEIASITLIARRQDNQERDE